LILDGSPDALKHRGAEATCRSIAYLNYKNIFPVKRR
jgi:hypothetical protein